MKLLVKNNYVGLIIGLAFLGLLAPMIYSQAGSDFLFFGSSLPTSQSMGLDSQTEPLLAGKNLKVFRDECHDLAADAITSIPNSRTISTKEIETQFYQSCLESHGFLSGLSKNELEATNQMNGLSMQVQSHCELKADATWDKKDGVQIEDRFRFEGCMLGVKAVLALL